jgi:hypothetical protein
MATKVYLEVGSKKTFACALDWPGWCRSGKTEEAALETLSGYAERFAPVAELAGFKFPASAGKLEVVDRVDGNATTDFGAIAMAVAADHEPLMAANAGRLAAFVEASWQLFDKVAAGAPAELQKGPRGGGRDRDKMIDHVLSAEAAYVRKIGLKLQKPALDDRQAIDQARAEILETLRAARSPMPEQDRPKAWPYRYAGRRIAWHVLDHAWEMQDRS